MGLVFSGIDPELNLVEILEIKSHPWFLACQFHPEFKSKPFAPHPLFVGFIKAALTRKSTRAQSRRMAPSRRVRTPSELRAYQAARPNQRTV